MLKHPEIHFNFADVMKELRSTRVDYSGQVLSRRQPSVVDKVLPVWPTVGKACVLPIADLVSEELQDDLANPQRCVLPPEEFPTGAPTSKAFASDEEWYSLLKAGFARGIFGEVSESDFFRDPNTGELVLSGAMGVDKFKVVDGTLMHYLRFICVFIPINSYLRRLRGGSAALPFLAQLTLVVLDDGGTFYVDSEDMESCFNIFFMPRCWEGYFAFSKKAPSSAFGGPAHTYSYVCMRAVPTGWIGAVDLMQDMARRVVFSKSGTPPDTEQLKSQPVPKEDVSVVCMDGFDFLEKIKGF